ncbi:helix-turn-helix domain-containing protein [Dysgonomonas sp. ZJ709]|uniref:helix-turn-helix domain-containing protein n=1 Tax=Dysgonomonas sp. ZJ709 TaxID=2709797 RepID=UPI0013EB31AF|nr:helix-turn-helix domain-containing protein [Dysgonomonas sp. ZJ709]
MENFRAIQPSMLLNPYIKQYWFLSVDNVAQVSQRAIPAGSMGLVFNRGDRVYNSSAKKEMLPRSYISGQSTTYTNTYFGILDLIIIVFQPIGARAFFDTPINELNEQMIPIDSFNDPLIIELEDHLMNTTDYQTCVYWIEQFLLKRIYEFEEYNYKRLSAVINSINYGESEISRLAQTACLSYKQFKRIFVEYAGLNPKEFLQINRFAKALHILQTQPSISVNDLAYQCSYYDKSHLIKDFKTFSGYTPTEFLANCDPYSDYMSLFQSFFINTK